MEITAVNNAQVKLAAELKQKKHRTKTGLFLAEGLRTVEEAIEARQVESIFYTPIEDGRTREALENAAAKGIKLFCVNEAVMKKISDTETPQGIIAVCNMTHLGLEELLSKGEMLLVLDRVQDPGNIGTMLRTADASGVGGLILLSGCADIYAPKTVRASMGSLFHIPVLQGINEETFIETAKDFGYELLVTSLEGATSLYKADLSGRIAFVMGNEANGVTDNLLKSADKKIFIPMQGKAESLNVAMAAGVVMFEALRRKINKK